MTLHRQFLAATAVMVLALILTGCDFADLGGEQGSGNLVTETRDVAEFTSVDVSSAVNMRIIVDPGAEPSVTVRYDDNMLDNLVTRVSGGTLTVTLDGNINLSGNADRVVELVMADLDSITASGATRVTAEGSTDRLELRVSGASSAHLEALTVGEIDVDASGASSVVLFVSDSATGSASGASNVTVRGDATDIRIETSGASSLDLP